MDYRDLKREYLDGVAGIGRRLGADTRTPDPLARMSERQRRRMRAPNFMTDDRWDWRELAGGSLVVEISYGRFLESPIFGVTVCCVRELAGDAEAWDNALSTCLHSVPEVLARLRELDEGGRERLAALAAAA